MDATTELRIRPDNRFTGKTATTPRPTADTNPGRDAALLAKDQEQWDEADAWAKMNARLRTERLAKRDAERDAQREARRREEDVRFVDGLKARYLAADPLATEGDFARDLPEMRRQHRIAAALPSGSADEAARLANSQRY